MMKLTVYISSDILKEECGKQWDAGNTQRTFLLIYNQFGGRLFDYLRDNYYLSYKDTVDLLKMDIQDAQDEISSADDPDYDIDDLQEFQDIFEDIKARHLNTFFDVMDGARPISKEEVFDVIDELAQ